MASQLTPSPSLEYVPAIMDRRKFLKSSSALRRYSTAAIALVVEGPAEIVGDNPFSLMGGCGAVWLRAKHRPGRVLLKATHPALGTREVQFTIVPAEAEVL